MNFLSEVINIVKDNEISDARLCLKRLTKEIQNLQNEANTYIDENYVEYNQTVVENNQLLEHSQRLAQEVDQLVDAIERDSKEEILAIADDVQRYLRELNELRIGLRVTNKLLKIDDLFERLNETKDAGFINFTRDTINALRELIYDQEDKDILINLDSFQNLKLRWLMENETLLNDLQKQFDSLFHLQEKLFQNTKCVDVKVSNDKVAFETILYMLYDTNFNANRLYTFLLKNVFEPIITRPVSFEVNKTAMAPRNGKPSEDYTTFTLSFSTKPFLYNDTNLRPSHKDVINCISKVFHCLRNLNILLPNGKSFFQQLAERIGDDVYKLIINECFTFAIPNTIEDLKASSLAEEIRQLNGFLKKIQFTTEANENKLIEYADKIDVIFKKRLCLRILKTATEIMHKDLHEMQIVEEIKTHHFPRCMVSRNTFEIIDLMEQVLRQAQDPSNQSVDTYVLNDIQEKLKSTIPMILEKYPQEIISVHGKFLQTIPQQTALFHNNCAYLAWWASKCNADCGDHSEAITVQLQEEGSKHFALQIMHQRSQLAMILKEFDLTDAMVELGPKPLNIIRQCLRQLDLLKNVWQTILPEIVYNKTMGTIINDFCDAIILKIMVCEDISSSVANGLVGILETIIERVPHIFSDPYEVNVHVKHWMKFQQIHMMLGATMAQIADQWADGKGPLTMHFRAEDVRHLIRALFQNTDLRANILAAIV